MRFVHRTFASIAIAFHGEVEVEVAIGCEYQPAEPDVGIMAPTMAVEDVFVRPKDGQWVRLPDLLVAALLPDDGITQEMLIAAYAEREAAQAERAADFRWA